MIATRQELLEESKKQQKYHKRQGGRAIDSLENLSSTVEKISSTDFRLGGESFGDPIIDEQIKILNQSSDIRDSEFTHASNRSAEKVGAHKDAIRFGHRGKYSSIVNAEKLQLEKFDIERKSSILKAVSDFDDKVRQRADFHSQRARQFAVDSIELKDDLKQQERENASTLITSLSNNGISLSTLTNKEVEEMLRTEKEKGIEISDKVFKDTLVERQNQEIEAHKKILISSGVSPYDIDNAIREAKNKGEDVEKTFEDLYNKATTVQPYTTQEIKGDRLINYEHIGKNKLISEVKELEGGSGGLSGSGITSKRGEESFDMLGQYGVNAVPILKGYIKNKEQREDALNQAVKTMNELNVFGLLETAVEQATQLESMKNLDEEAKSYVEILKNPDNITEYIRDSFREQLFVGDYLGKLIPQGADRVADPTTSDSWETSRTASNVEEAILYMQELNNIKEVEPEEEDDGNWFTNLFKSKKTPSEIRQERLRNLRL